jgi:GxxExxY protein
MIEAKERKKEFIPIPKHLDEVGTKIVQAAFNVHRELGPGLLEKVYEVCFCHELTNMGLNVKRQIIIPVVYKTLTFEEGLRLDVLIEDTVICELKAVDELNPVWEAQILSHLKLTNNRLGYLINFNVRNIGSGIKRFAK